MFRSGRSIAIMNMTRRNVALASWLACLGCSDNQQEQPKFSRAQLLDPQTCRECHATHYDEWSGSMHAYAADDPVFLAMNARGQRETGGKLGDFCVRCHAPMALEEKATTDGLNLPSLPQHLKGVTCYFCHNVESVEGTHNNPLRLANDTVMRGGIRDPLDNSAHASAYSRFTDREHLDSSAACGACHDLVTSTEFAPASVHLERTFAEWRAGIFNVSGEDGQRCGTCHMPESDGSPVAEYPGVGVRTRHEHDFPAVDVAMTDFPNITVQTEKIRTLLDRTLRVEVCVGRDIPRLRVLLDNAGAGHHWPSGAGQDRRAWVEVIAYSGQQKIFESAAVPDDQDVTQFEDEGAWVIRDRTFKSDGTPAHMFWDVASEETGLISGAVTLSPTDPNFLITHVARLFPNGALLPGRPDRVTVRVRLRPIGLDVLDDLIASGDLSESFREKMPVFTLSPARNASPPWSPELTIEWTREIAAMRNYGFLDAVEGRPAD
jgi:hypothetical protein